MSTFVMNHLGIQKPDPLIIRMNSFANNPSPCFLNLLDLPFTNSLNFYHFPTKFYAFPMLVDYWNSFAHSIIASE